ncbi:MAG: extracellular solute-binding protein [Anaerolineae bacterium]|nr:extracellular solute-binding protein [Anaerolineae bacterium]
MKLRLFICWLAGLGAILLALAGCGANRENGPLLVLEWAGYEQPQFWEKFAQEHPNVEVEYTFFADDPEAFAKIQSGFQADMVHPNTSWLQLYVDNDLVQPIDPAKLSNWPLLLDNLAEAGQVNGQQYLVPWEWGYDSIIVRPDKVQEMPDSWADLWDPQYAGHVTIFDSAENSVIIAATVLGYDPYTLTESQLAEIKQKLIELKPNLLGYWSDYTELNQQIASGEIWVAVAWPDAYLAVKTEGVPVEYVTPQEGRLGWVYGLVIPKNAQNPELAYDYIDAMIETQAMLALINEFGYAAANKEAMASIDPELADLMLLNQPELLDRTIFYKPLTAEQRKNWTAMWDEVKATE